jgi:hypothetical protein
MDQLLSQCPLSVYCSSQSLLVCLIHRSILSHHRQLRNAFLHSPHYHCRH